MTADPSPLPPLAADWQPAVEAAGRALREGAVVAYPTETVWGLAAHPDLPGATERLSAAKGREPGKALQVSCADAGLALELARPSRALEVLSGLWPGPLTLVVPASEGCPPALAPGGRVGLRVPDHPLAVALLRAAGGRLLTTSCNRAGEAPALSHQEALDSGLADFVLPEPPGLVQPAGGEASTVVLLPEGLILRAGALSAERIRAALRVAGRPAGDA